MQASPGFAGVQDSVFFISPDGSNIAFDVREVSRREVLDRLLVSRAIELDWVDSGFGDEKISGVFKGSADSVLQRLLAQTDFVAVYDRNGEKSRIARLIIVGKASSQSKQATVPALPGIEANTPLSTGDGPAPPLKPVSGAADFTLPSPRDLAMPLFVPAPPGTPAPTLVPPSAADAALPLFKPPETKAR
jgi:hypothetical protein